METQSTVFVNSAFVNPTRLFDETLNLLEEARDFLIHYRRMTLSELAAKQFSVEATRLTARLTEMMAWLLGRRAVASGEISYEMGRQQFRLSFQSVCDSEQESVLEPELSALGDLLERSLVLYRRIAAMDAAFDAGHPDASEGLFSAANRR